MLSLMRTNVLVVVATTLTVLVSGQTISTDKISYAYNEPIIINWSYSTAQTNDWISLYPASQNPPLPSGSTMWIYMRSLTQTAQSGTRPNGTVTFGPNDPVESGSQTWPLQPGSYKVHITREVAAPYPTVASSVSFTVLDPKEPTSAPVSGQTISTNKISYAYNEPIVISWSYITAETNDWISLYPASQNPPLPSGSTMWVYMQSLTQTTQSGTRPSGTVTFGPTNPVESGTQTWPLKPGSYKVHITRDVAAPYPTVASSVSFTVLGATGPTSAPISTCTVATTAVSSTTHLPPNDGLVISKVAFSSCYKPASQNSATLWKHVRDNFGINSVWVWLGDNMYADTDNQNTKRQAYNAARDDARYKKYGPVAEPKIPTTGTWDDHDYGWNNMGKEYSCRRESQNEFVKHFNVPSSDLRHPSQGANQQAGVYSSYMFNKTASIPNGIHLIMLDARYHRSPTFSTYGRCEGSKSTVLGSAQWTWLKNELLNKVSEIKIIGSGIQVLPPTHTGRSLTEYCAYDGPNGTFVQANTRVSEGSNYGSGTEYEAWAEIPQERSRLLRLCQKSIRLGKAKKIIFLSGDQHWAEIMAKKVPARRGFGEVTLFEVTASGIDQNWNYDVPNPNRIRPRLANTNGSGKYVHECMFPFTYQGVTYTDCANNKGVEWCYYNIANGLFGNCQPKSDMIVPTATTTSTRVNICTNNAMHVCNAQANYGSIEVNWNTSVVQMSIFTPHQSGSIVPATVTVPL